MDYKALYYPEVRFGGFTDIDGTIAFYTRVNELIRVSSVVLDVGCGRGTYGEDPIRYRKGLRILTDKCTKVIGIDVDERAARNPFVDEFHLIKGTRWPVEGESVDVCLCDNVLEHVEHPEAFFSECRRVLKPGGYVCIRTPNVLSYFRLCARIIPNRFHGAVIRKVQAQRKEEDVFPTFYRCNTRRMLRMVLDKHGFDHCVYGYEAEPSYLSFSRFFYRLGVLHQKLAPNAFKVTLFAFGRKLPIAERAVPETR